MLKNIFLNQVAIFFVFGILLHIILSALLDLTNSILSINLIVWMMAGLIFFYMMGINAKNPTRLDRFYFFILQAFVCAVIGILQGNEFGDVLTFLVNRLFRYWFPLFQIMCMLGYNLGLRKYAA